MKERKTDNFQNYDSFIDTLIRIIKSRRMRWAGHVAPNGGEEERV
jgi:hypothetical protein